MVNLCLVIHRYTDPVGNDWGRPELLAAYNTAISGQNWGKVAEELFKKYYDVVSVNKGDGNEVLWKPDALTALTEMAELAYERGRDMF